MGSCIDPVQGLWRSYSSRGRQVRLEHTVLRGSIDSNNHNPTTGCSRNGSAGTSLAGPSCDVAESCAIDAAPPALGSIACRVSLAEQGSRPKPFTSVRAASVLVYSRTHAAPPSPFASSGIAVSGSLVRVSLVWLRWSPKGGIVGLSRGAPVRKRATVRVAQ